MSTVRKALIARLEPWTAHHFPTELSPASVGKSAAARMNGGARVESYLMQTTNGV